MAFKYLRLFASMFGKGLFYAVKRLFTLYPNPTWAVITAAVVITAYVQIGYARAERDEYGRTNAILQHQLDSIQGKNIKYNKTALWN